VRSVDGSRVGRSSRPRDRVAGAGPESCPTRRRIVRLPRSRQSRSLGLAGPSQANTSQHASRRHRLRDVHGRNRDAARTTPCSTNTGLRSPREADGWFRPADSRNQTARFYHERALETSRSLSESAPSSDDRNPDRLLARGRRTCPWAAGGFVAVSARRPRRSLTFGISLSKISSAVRA
jgi:hypothetical protein